jgi:hypothetical protein
MATLFKYHRGPMLRFSDRESWLRLAIEFMRRGLWLSEAVTVHGPHEASNRMWGDFEGWVDGPGPRFADDNAVACDFNATADGSKYRPFRIVAWNQDDKSVNYPVLPASQLSPKARRWMKAARRTLAALAAERRAANNFHHRRMAELKGGA